MEAKERIYNGMKMNGFLALAFNLIVLPVLAFLTVYYMIDIAWFSIPVMIILSLAFFIKATEKSMLFSRKHYICA